MSLALVVPLLVAVGAPPPATPPAPIQLDAAALSWVPAPKTMPAGTMMAVLEGDPKAADLFTIRLRLPAGFALPAHTHPSPERVTVLEGSVAVAFTTAADDAAKKGARVFSVGAFYVNPPGIAHAVWSDAGAVLQLTGVGPWKVESVPPPAAR